MYIVKRFTLIMLLIIFFNHLRLILLKSHLPYFTWHLYFIWLTFYPKWLTKHFYYKHHSFPWSQVSCSREKWISQEFHWVLALLYYHIDGNVMVMQWHFAIFMIIRAPRHLHNVPVLIYLFEWNERYGMNVTFLALRWSH